MQQAMLHLFKKKVNKLLGRNLGYKRFQGEQSQNDFDFLKYNGLDKNSIFLDIGCGGGRIGIPAINFLTNSRYYGIDKEKMMIKKFQKTVSKLKYEYKAPTLLQTKLESGWEGIDQSLIFNFIYAYSVFSHLKKGSILKILNKAKQHMSSSSKFYATFLLGDHYLEGRQHLERKNEMENVWYSINDIEKMAESTSLSVEFIGDEQKNWEGVPRGLFDPNVSQYNETSRWSPVITKECLEGKCPASPHTHGYHQEMFLFKTRS